MKNAVYIGVDIGDKTTSMFYATDANNNQVCIHLPGTLGTRTRLNITSLTKLKKYITILSISRI